MRNWIADQNPFGLPAPPVWWLRKLEAADRELVIMPGLSESCYRVARRSPRARLLKALAHESETARMVRHGCVPVVSLVPFVVWNEDFFQWLRDADTWSHGGPTIDDSLDRFAQKLDAADEDAAARLDLEQADHVDQIGSSSYFALKQRTGSQVFVRRPDAATV